MIVTPSSQGVRDNNWDLFKDHRWRSGLFEIFDGFATRRSRCAARLAKAWRRCRTPCAPPTRSQAPGARDTTPQMDLLVEKALANGAEAAKVCGAGGGGCIAFLCAEGRKRDVERALAAESGAEILDWKVAREGLEVTSD